MGILDRRGSDDADLWNILGGNYLRVFAQVWK
jgi:microsomal dipeptidase-like Zn-dependent dipeptidase